MKFSEMAYERPKLDELKQEIAALTRRLEEAGDYASAREVFLKKDELEKHISTLSTLASIRHSIDTRDEYYDKEMKFWNAAMPELQEYQQAWTAALLASPYRDRFAAEYGDLMFVNAEMELKTFSPELIPELQMENDLTQEYEKLLASAQIPFEDGVYTLSQMSPFKNDPDDARRFRAWKAEGQWYKDNQEKLDGIYDELVHLRDQMGKKLGYEGYTELGYYRMGRNCYTKEDVEKFRKAVREYLVPVADGIYREQARRIGKEYPMSFADNALEFRSGNPKPCGTPEEILEQGRRFYDELSPETSEFFRMMLDNGLMDVLSTEGKEGGGYCTSIPDYGVPFIFANFNGTQHDIEVVTHEAGHAFAYYMNRDRVPMSSCWPGMEACEVHSMSMEFMSWPWAEGFFERAPREASQNGASELPPSEARGRFPERAPREASQNGASELPSSEARGRFPERAPREASQNTRKFLYSHLAGALTFIPYGTMVDHFQHIVYEKPDLTPKERHSVWKELLGIYMPWMKLDGEIPFYADGEGWQRQHHIYSFPFYYIDYCLAQTVSLEFWAMLQQGMEGGEPTEGKSGIKRAWEHYMAYTKQGGSRVFTELLANAGLKSPFDESCLREVCETARAWLTEFDLTGIK
ncbi:MAG: M3 family oligoendopeptidase [Lachnospiraceae bacterium]|nr:M3 family oligoendopeptidase [Lachnospiraceae bacterium]